MPNNWKTYKLEDALDALIDYRGKTPKKKKSGIPLITAKIVKKGKILEPTEFIAFEDYDSWMTRGIPVVGDVVLTTEAPLGEVAQLKDSNIALAQRIVTLRGKQDFLDNGYLKYFLQSTEGQRRLVARESGTTVAGIKQSELRKILIDFPCFQEQQALASVLSAIDDKVENNLAINKTLEEMALALYKHWFVDFGPFHDGEFVESELGMIPKGWEVRPFLDLFKLLSGGTPKTTVEDYWNGDLYWVSAKDIGSNSGGSYINDTEKKITQLGIDKSAAKILPEDTVIVVARGSVGKFGIIAKPMAINQSCYGIYSKSDYSQALTYLLIKSLMSHFMNVSYGSVFDTITTSTFQNINVLVPPKEIFAEIKKQVDVNFEQIKENIKENQSLTQLRDTLLPQLFSGTVRLKEFRETVEEVV